MEDAFTLVFSILGRFLDLFFNHMVIVQGVTVGWVLIVCLMFGIVISSLLNVPNGVLNRSFVSARNDERRESIRESRRLSNGS